MLNQILVHSRNNKDLHPNRLRFQPISPFTLTNHHQVNKKASFKSYISVTNYIAFTSVVGTLSIFEATVPGRGKNWFMKRLGNLYSLIRSKVSFKSCF